ncbi:hypothetical protein LguiB_008623 [Lonicera macranthoides]
MYPFIITSSSSSVNFCSNFDLGKSSVTSSFIFFLPWSTLEMSSSFSSSSGLFDDDRALAISSVLGLETRTAFGSSSSDSDTFSSSVEAAARTITSFFFFILISWFDLLLDSSSSSDSSSLSLSSSDFCFS